MSLTTVSHQHKQTLAARCGSNGLMHRQGQNREASSAPPVLRPTQPVDSPAPALEALHASAVAQHWHIQALLLEALACDASGEDAGAAVAIERALELIGHDPVLWPFLFHPVPALLERHAQGRTAHGDVIAEILTVAGGVENRPSLEGFEGLREPLTECELRVLRYLPTNLSLRNIADELYVSVNTVKTHVRHLYAKLDARTRGEAVELARELGLLRRSSRSRTTTAVKLVA
jgi:LuxR family transcriptional regulator, maltose regulon positive regulatory protein